MAVEINNLSWWERCKLLFFCVVLLPSWLLQKVIPLPKGHPWLQHRKYGLVEWTLRAGEFKFKISAGLCAVGGLAVVGVVNGVQGDAAPSYLPLIGVLLTVVAMYYCGSLYMDMERRWAQLGEEERRRDDQG